MMGEFKSRTGARTPWMGYIGILICLVFCVGCSPQEEANADKPEGNVDVDDGGEVENTDRDKCEAFFVQLGKVRSVEGEKTVLNELGIWLKQNGYKINVVEKNGKHHLNCPYFPPVTPWIEHTFFDVRNLELLPLADNDG